MPDVYSCASINVALDYKIEVASQPQETFGGFMDKWLKCGVTALAFVGCCSAAKAADLLGDTLSFMRAFPNTSTQFGAAIPNTTVAVGTADQVGWNLTGVPPFFVLINPEPDRIVFTFPVLNGYVTTPNVFDGYVITGFDFDIASVSVMNNTTGAAVLLGGGPRQITVDISGDAQATQSFTLAVSLVPEPNTVALFALGISALVLRARHAANTRVSRDQPVNQPN